MERDKRHDDGVRVGELVTVSAFRARLAEMISRVERGEEVVIARGQEPVAKLIGLKPKRRRRLGVLKELVGQEAADALMEAFEKPLSPDDQAALEGGLTDALGIAKR